MVIRVREDESLDDALRRLKRALERSGWKRDIARTKYAVRKGEARRQKHFRGVRKSRPPVESQP